MARTRGDRDDNRDSDRDRDGEGDDDGGVETTEMFAGNEVGAVAGTSFTVAGDEGIDAAPPVAAAGTQQTCTKLANLWDRTRTFFSDNII